MHLDEALEVTARYARLESFEQFQKHLDPQWITEALELTGTASMRRRRLPADQAVWLIIAMAMFRDRPIVELVDKLELALPDRQGRAMAPSAMSDARGRLGVEALEWLVGHTGRVWGRRSAERHRWRGLALYGVDGSTLRAPDSAENRDYFGGHTTHRGSSGYPLVRIVVLMVLRSHLVAAARMGPFDRAESDYAADLWSEVPNESLTVVDRLYFSAATLLGLSRGGHNRHWLLRAKSNTKWEVLKKLGRGDELVQMKVSAAARQKDPSLPEVWQARAIQYQRKGFRSQTLLTSLLDAERYPAAELAELYHERWELELGYDEMKTEMLEREEALRSQLPARVLQETCGLVLAYNLIRLEMERVAEAAGVAPTRISFVAAFREIRDEWMWLEVTKPGAIPLRLQKLAARLQRFILPERRRERAYPRAVKIKMSKFPRNRGGASATGKGA